MPPIYNLLTEYFGADDNVVLDADIDTDDISSAPYWAICIIRLNNPLSYSRAAAGTDPEIDFSEGIQARGDDSKIVITSDCTTLSVSSTKDSHTSQLNATLLQTDKNYLTEILPGDWVFAWMVHGKDRFDKLIERINSDKPCNEFDDGLKFIGRAHSIRKHLTVGTDGRKTVRIQFQAYGFHEFDSHYLYSQYLTDDSDLANKMSISLAKIGINLNDVIGEQATIENIDNVHLIIPALINIFFGKGLVDINSEQAGTPTQAFGFGAKPPPSSDGLDDRGPQLGYLVPKSAVAFLGRDSGNKLVSYIDLLQILVGVQSYDDSGMLPFIDESNALTKGVIRYTGKPLQGAFLILPPAYDNRSIWEMLYQFLNPLLNEMYTCLKVGKNGRVFPTLVVRQHVFATPQFADKQKLSSVNSNDPAVPVTPYMSVPRWLMSPTMVRALDIGTSNATRCNFVWLLGQDPNMENNLALPKQAALNDPIVDQYDIAKNGLSAITDVVPVNIVNQEGARARKWSEMAADHLMGSQYTFNGSIQSVGIQAPISEGDNVELSGLVYHIEGIANNCVIDESGNKTWSTTLTVTRGMPKDDDGSKDDLNEGNSIFGTFQPTKASAAESDARQGRGLDPQTTKDDEG